MNSLYTSRKECPLLKKHWLSTLILGAVLLCLTDARASDQRPIKIGYFDLPPHVIDTNSGQPRGAAISYFEQYIAPHLEVLFEWKNEITPPTRLMKQLSSGEIDAMIFLGRTAEREKYLHYPEPYLVMPEMFAFRRDHPIDTIDDLEDLKGLRVGFLVGGRIPDELQNPTLIYDLIAGKRLMERNLEKLLLGRIDAIYAPLPNAVVFIAEEQNVREKIKMLPLSFLKPVEIYTVFSKNSVNIETVNKYNRALRLAKDNLNYSDYLEKLGYTVAR